MANVKVLQSNFTQYEISIVGESLLIKHKQSQFTGDIVPIEEILNLEVATERSVKKVAGTIGWGLVGGALIGPFGTVAGLLLGGQGSKTTFIAELTDNRIFAGEADTEAYIKLSTRLKSSKTKLNANNQFNLNERDVYNSNSIENENISLLIPLAISSDGILTPNQLDLAGANPSERIKLIRALKEFGEYYAIGSWDGSGNHFKFEYYDGVNKNWITTYQKAIISMLDAVDECVRIGITAEEYIDPGKHQKALQRIEDRKKSQEMFKPLINVSIPIIIVMVVLVLLMKYF